MNNKISFLIWITMCIGFLIIFSQTSCETKEKNRQNKKLVVEDTFTASSKESDGIDIKGLAGFDSIIVIHFHPTAQCSCCINVGNFSKKGLEKFYAKPYKDGRIVFRECNIDEDSLTAKKYQIFWSALGFTKLSKGKNEFKEIESVWEFCEDEVKFLIDFQKEFQSFVACKKEEKTRKDPK